MSETPDIPAELEYTVIDVVKTDPPRGIHDGNWFRYTIKHGSSPITGMRSGSMNSVRRYAEEFAENLNERTLTGYSAYRARKPQNK